MEIAYFPKNDDESFLFSREFKRRGIDFHVFSPTDVWLGKNAVSSCGVGPDLTLEDLKDTKKADRALSDFDIVFQRSVSSWNRIYGQEIVRFFFDVLELSSKDVKVINPPSSTLNARRKHVALSILAKNKIPVLPFYASPNPVRNMQTTKKIEPPLMVKTLEGAGGIGVVFAPDKLVAGDLLSLFYKNGQIPIIQPFMDVDYDIRVFILGNELLGSIKRESDIHKHNISLGGKASNIPVDELSPEIIEYSLRACDILSLSIAGVDIIDTPKGPYILEVNPSPGFKGLSRSTKIKVHEKIVNFLISQS